MYATSDRELINLLSETLGCYFLLFADLMCLSSVKGHFGPSAQTSIPSTSQVHFNWLF